MSKFDLLNTSTVVVEAGSLDGATYLRQGADLIIQFDNSSEDIVLNNFTVAAASEMPVQLTLSDGTVVSLDQLQAAVDASEISNIAPAAGGPAGGGSGGGAAFSPATDDGIGDGLSIEGLLEGTAFDNTRESVIEELEEALAEAVTTTTPDPTIIVDPCNDLFDTKVAAFRETFRDQPTADDPDGFQYHKEGEVVDGDGNQPENTMAFDLDVNTYGSFSLFNDEMNSGNTKGLTGTIVGDQYGHIYYQDYNMQLDLSAYMGESNAEVSVFNDDITGTTSTTAIIGDQFSELKTIVAVESNMQSSFRIGGSDENANVSDNTVLAFNDSLVGGENSELIVGDHLVVSENSYRIASMDAVTSFYVEGVDASNNVFSANEDIIDGSAGTGVQLLVGDLVVGSLLLGGSQSFDPINVISDIAFSAELEENSATYSGNQSSSQGDLMIGGSGFDIMAGDLFMEDYTDGSELHSSSVTLNTESGFITEGYIHKIDNTRGFRVEVENGGTAENNHFSFHDDIMEGGAGTDLMVGDAIVFADGDNDDGILTKFVVDSEYEAIGETESFNDSLFSATGGTIQNNSYSAFNDILRGDDGTDDGSNNGDMLVGDLYAAGNTHAQAQFNMNVAYYEASDPAANGVISGNAVDAWSDTLIGGAGNDFLVGDVWFETSSSESNTLEIDGNGLSDGGNLNNELSAFNDVLCGGEGADTLIGDFYGSYEAVELERGTRVEGDFDIVDENGVAIGTFFEDTLQGDGGDDVLIGQLGDDTLTGGEGADTFAYEGADDWDTIYRKEEVDGDDRFRIEVQNNTITRSEGHDFISDFNYQEEGDTIDLDALFDNLGITDTDQRAYQVNIEDNVLTIEGVDNFSITIAGDALPNVMTSTNLMSDELAELGIIVGEGIHP
ncbi:MAG: calcium-binding protein [Sneathiella sp.]